jgi:hypothetical protein
MTQKSVVPALITQLGVATERDVDIDTLADRLRREVGEMGDAASSGASSARGVSRKLPGALRDEAA